jgi:hypothetical protein
MEVFFLMFETRMREVENWVYRKQRRRVYRRGTWFIYFPSLRLTNRCHNQGGPMSWSKHETLYTLSSPRFPGGYQCDRRNHRDRHCNAILRHLLFLAAKGVTKDERHIGRKVGQFPINRMDVAQFNVQSRVRPWTLVVRFPRVTIALTMSRDSTGRRYTLVWLTFCFRLNDCHWVQQTLDTRRS